MEALDCLPLYEDATFYDLEFEERNFDIDFYRIQALKTQGPVLELACGTGRITFALAKAGVDIHGLDVAPAMIERAKMKAKSMVSAIELTCADARSFDLGRRFDLIFAAANSLQHLHSAESVLQLLKCAKEHLAPGGRLILDVFNPDLTKLMRPSSDRYLHKKFNDEKGRSVQVEAASQYDAATQILTFDLYYSRPPEGAFLTKHVTMRCFFPQELDLLARTAGFSIQHKYGGYDSKEFRSNSAKQILILTRSEETPRNTGTEQPTPTNTGEQPATTPAA
jgi:SAM-dependent methyltransferase